ncbi:hypothetical protein BK131_10930 [Paenibacillus amylolyticus]|uniref:Uncharacterized protein n=1 Tax=Paenibacillus amylolyticus TaxID=1451 RepID=A0A1R1BZT6_PAEAM|nr:hypothetical protein BK131_10930 [Paenibacillus amylolyticus]
MWLFDMPAYRRIRQDKVGRDSGKRRKELSFSIIHITTRLILFSSKIRLNKTAHNINYAQFCFKSIFIFNHVQQIMIIFAEKEQNK